MHMFLAKLISSPFSDCFWPFLMLLNCHRGLSVTSAELQSEGRCSLTRWAVQCPSSCLYLRRRRRRPYLIASNGLLLSPPPLLLDPSKGASSHWPSPPLPSPPPPPHPFPIQHGVTLSLCLSSVRPLPSFLPSFAPPPPLLVLFHP